MEPFQPTSPAVTAEPLELTSAFHELVMLWPPGHVHVSVQPLMALSPAVMSTLPCQPEPQSLTTSITAVQPSPPVGGGVVSSSGGVVSSGGSVGPESSSRPKNSMTLAAMPLVMRLWPVPWRLMASTGACEPVPP